MYSKTILFISSLLYVLVSTVPVMRTIASTKPTIRSLYHTHQPPPLARYRKTWRKTCTNTAAPPATTFCT